jgi:hypothetical protein
MENNNLGIETILNLYPEYDKVLGPYTRKDGRIVVVLNNSLLPNKTKGKLRTISYPKALKEIQLGRRLVDDETVDHNDRDFTNNDLSNLIVRPRPEHSKLDALHRIMNLVSCVWCRKEFAPTKSQVLKRSKEKAGPFCSKSCSGNYGVKIQNKQMKRIKREVIKVVYGKLNK